MLETSEHGAIRELRLARPPVNALDPEMVGALVGGIETAIADRVSALVLSGRPGVFSGGLDVPALLRLDRDALGRFWTQFFELQHRIAASPIPVIAAITGHCPAGGTVISLYCDHRIMARGAFRIGLNEVQVGLYPGPIIHRAFERLVGTRRAASLLVRGALLGPDEALAAGLVDEVVAPEDVVTRALAFAGELASLPASALRRTRALVRGELVSLFTEAPAPLFEEANAVWFDPETQQRLRELFARKPV